MAISPLMAADLVIGDVETLATDIVRHLSVDNSDCSYP